MNDKIETVEHLECCKGTIGPSSLYPRPFFVTRKVATGEVVSVVPFTGMAPNLCRNAIILGHSRKGV
jgi:hypothetical protein